MAAIGSVSTPARNPRVASLAGVHDGADIAPALQAAIDAVAAAGGGTVEIPAGTYTIGRDVYVDHDGVEIVGAGRAATSLATVPMASILFGLPRAPGGATLGAGHWVDLFGKLDAAAAPAPGARRGLRTHDPSAGTWGHPTFSCSPFQYGQWVGDGGAHYRPDFWAATPVLTVDFALDAPGGSLPNGQIFGAVRWVDRASPLYGFYIGGDYWFQFSTLESDGSTVERRFYLRSPTITAGVQRFSFEIDLAAATVRLWYNGTQRAPDLGSIGAGWMADAARRFYPNRHSPFNLGTLSFTNVNWGTSEPISAVTQLDRTFCGLRYTAATIYANDGVGQPQRRVDNATLNDLSRFFGEDPGTFAYLALTDGPADNRRVTVNPGPAGGSQSRGLFLSEEHWFILNDARQHNALRNMTIRTIEFNWTAPVTLFVVWYYEMTGVRIDRGGVHGLGGLIGNNSYTVLIRDCDFHGTDAGLFASAWLGRVENCTILYPGRAAMRFLSCGVKIDGLFTAGNTVPAFETMLDFHGNIEAEIVRAIFDAEAPAATPVAAIRAEASGELNNVALSVHDSTLGPFLTPDASAIVLDTLVDGAGNPLTGALATLAVERVALQTDLRSFVRVRSSGRAWVGRVRGCRPRPVGTFGVPGGVNWVEYDHEDSIGSIKVELDDQGLPPNQNAWARNSFILRVPDPRPGQYAAWIGPYKGGTYGTTNPPDWTGIDPVGDGRALAGYALERSYCVYEAVFSLATVPGLQLWLKADAITGLSDTAPVATWPDASGHGRDASQATAGKRPLYRTGVLNGLPIVRLDGLNDFLTVPSSGLDLPGDLFMVFVSRMANLGDYHVYISKREGDWASACYELRHSSNPHLQFLRAGASNVVATNLTAVAGQFALIALESSGGTVNFYFNGVMTDTGGNPGFVGASGTGAVHLGIRDDLTNPAPADFAEVLVYSAVPSSGDRDRIFNVLNEKYLIY